MSKRIAVLTTGRQDWGILRSTCRAIRAKAGLELVLIAGGMHLSAFFGGTVAMLEDEGFRPDVTLRWIDDEGRPGPVQQTGAAVAQVGEALASVAPDALVVVGDRFETAGAVLAATLARVPVVHLHGGEETEGAIDNALRHAITKMSHLHLVSHAEYAARIAAMGEDPATIHDVGAPGLDNIHRTDLADRAELEAHLGIPLEPPVVLVTVHPTTLAADPAAEARAVAAAMDRITATYVVTLPNADPGNEMVRALLIEACGKPRRVAAAALGERRYWGLLRTADAIMGNSSSAVIEAPVVALPAVNVGDRQRGRLRGANLIDCAADADSVSEALTRALDPEFRARVRAAPCPFGDGRSAGKIVEILAGWDIPRPPVKRRIAPQDA